jgi:hypothetical protein
VVLSNTSLFLTWSVQLTFSILLQHHISKISMCFRYTARSVQVSAPYRAVPFRAVPSGGWLRYVALFNSMEYTRCVYVTFKLSRLFCSRTQQPLFIYKQLHVSV